MTHRSTRNKLRFQAEKAIQNLERAMQNLAQIDGIAAERSPYIDENMPKIVLMIDGCKQVLIQFREGL